MKKSEIILGHEYSNGQFAHAEVHRKVVGMYIHFPTEDIYVSIIDTYRDMKPVTTYPPHSYDILLKSFAKWAKKDIT